MSNTHTETINPQTGEVTTTPAPDVVHSKVQRAKDQSLNTFALFIQQLEGGALHEELTEKIKEAVSEIADACFDRGGAHKSTVTLKLDFAMNQKDRIVEVGADIVTKYPKAPRGRAGMFFCSADGTLTREDPRQRTFDDELERRRAEGHPNV